MGVKRRRSSFLVPTQPRLRWDHRCVVYVSPSTVICVRDLGNNILVIERKTGWSGVRGKCLYLGKVGS